MRKRKNRGVADRKALVIKAVVAALILCGIGVAFLAVPTSSSSVTVATTVPSYAMGISGQSWSIEGAADCSETIGAGGNLHEGRRVFFGKCQGAGESPRVTGTTNPALTFRTDKDFRYSDAILQDSSTNTWIDAAGKTLRDRSELATRWDLPLHTDVWVGFDIRIPAGVSDVSGYGAYVLQLWQCTASPIAGVRIQSGAGNGHKLQFVRRGEDPSVDYNRSMATTSIGTNEWHSFVIKYRVEPYQAGGAKGSIEVYQRRVGATTTERKLLDRAEYFGYAQSSTCPNDSFKDAFRIKFGMYKDYQPGSTFRADFRNVRIGSSKAEVQPYFRD